MRIGWVQVRGLLGASSRSREGLNSRVKSAAITAKVANNAATTKKSVGKKD
jgi:hypothetical protein